MFLSMFDRAFGLVKGSGKFHLSSPLDDSLDGLAGEYKYGDTISVELEPRAIRILNFDKTVRDWSVLKKLQTRTEGPKPPEVVPIDKHAILGTWEYRHRGSIYTRQFTKDGYCILRKGGEQIWKKLFQVKDKKTVNVQGVLGHVLVDSNTLKIEGRYTARRE